LLDCGQNFFGAAFTRDTGGLPPDVTIRGVQVPRPPSFDHGVISFVWAVAFGLFIWAGLLSVGVPKATAVLLAIVAGFLIFLYVRVYGEEEVRSK
jgi:hypothetical protein